jgi:hypothetical protein
MQLLPSFHDDKLIASKQYVIIRTHHLCILHTDQAEEQVCHNSRPYLTYAEVTACT